MAGILSNIFGGDTDLRPTDTGLPGNDASGAEEGSSSQQEEQMAADRGSESGERSEASTGDTGIDAGLEYHRDVHVEREVEWQDAEGGTHSNTTTLDTGVDVDVDILLSSSADTAFETADDF